MFVLTVWFQFIPANQWLPFGRPKQSAGIKTDYACRARSWLSPWTRTYLLLKNEPWRQRRGPCGEQPGMTATENVVSWNTSHQERFSLRYHAFLCNADLYLNCIFPLMNGAFEAISTFFGYRNPWIRYILNFYIYISYCGFVFEGPEFQCRPSLLNLYCPFQSVFFHL